MNKDLTLEINANTKQAISEINQLKQEIKHFTTNVDTSSNSLKKNQVTLDAVTKRVGALAVAFGGFEVVKDMVTTFAEFEKTIAKLGAISGASANELQQLQDKSRELGKTTQYSASQVAEAMNYQAMAGMKTNEILEATQDVLNLASVGQMDLARASDIATDSMSGFGLEAEDMQRVTDVMAVTTTNANTNVEQLGEAFKNVAPVSKNLNVSLEETSAMLGVLANSGRKGGEAGTHLKIILQRLASTSKPVLKAFKSIGVEAYTTDGKLKPMTETLKAIQGKLKNLSEQDRNDILKDLFGEEAIASASIILDNLDDMDTLITKVGDSSGKAGSMAKDMNDNLSGHFKELKSALEDLQLEIGESLSPVLDELTKTTTEWIRSIDPKTLKGIGDAFGGIVSAVQALATILIDLNDYAMPDWLGGEDSTFLGKVAEGWGYIGEAVGKFSRAISGEFNNSIEKADKNFKSLDKSVKDFKGDNKEFSKLKTSIDDAVKSNNKLIDQMRADDAEFYASQIKNLTDKNFELKKVYEELETKKPHKEIAKNAKEATTATNQLALTEKQHQEDYLKDLDKRISKEKEKDQTLEESYNSELEYLKTLKFSTEEFTKAKEKLDKLYTQQLAEAYKKRVDEHTKTVDKLQAKETDLTKKIVDLNKKLVDDLKKIDNDRLHSKEALEGKIHNLSMVGASDVAKYHDKQKQADEKLSKAKIALKNGELEAYKRYKNQYESLVTSIANTEIREGNNVVVSKKKSADYGINALRKLSGLEDSYYNQQKTKTRALHNQKLAQLKAQLTATKAQLQLEVQRLQLEKQLVEATTGQKIDIDVSGALSAIKNIDNSIDKLDKQIKNPKKIDIDNAQANQSIDEVKQKYTTLKLGNKVFRIDANTTPADLGISKLINKRDGEKVSIEVNPEYEKAEREIKSAIKGFERQEVEAKVGADTSKADTKLKSFKDDVTTKPLISEVKANVKKAKATIKKLKDSLKKPSKHEVKITISESSKKLLKNIRKNTKSTHTVKVVEVKTKATGGLIEPIYRADGGEVDYQRKSGRISGYDASDSDDVPAMLTRGEFVVKRDAVAHYGDDFLYGLNNMQIPQKYATGGLVNIGTPQRDTKNNDNYNSYDNSSNDSYDNSYNDIQEKEPIDTSELESLLSEISSFKTKPMNSTFLGQLTRLEGEARNTINSASHSTQENISTKTSEIESKFSEVQSKYEEFITKVSEVKEKANSENVDEIDKSGLESVVDEIQSAKNDEEMPSKIKQVYTSLENKKDVPLKYEELQEKDKKTIDKIGEGITEKIEKSKLDKDDKEVDKTFINAENKADNFDKSVTKIEKVFDKLGSQFEQFKVFKHEIDASKLSLVSKIAQAKIQQSLASQWVFGGRNGRRAKHWANQVREMQRAMKAKDASLKKAENNFKLPKFQTGGQINGLEGGKLKGYGGGDKNLALLEDGEFIIKKEAVAHHGTGFMEQINNMKSAIPKFATGGLIGYNKPEQLVQSYDSGGGSSGGNSKGSDGYDKKKEEIEDRVYGVIGGSSRHHFKYLDTGYNGWKNYKNPSLAKFKKLEVPENLKDKKLKIVNDGETIKKDWKALSVNDSRIALLNQKIRAMSEDALAKGITLENNPELQKVKAEKVELTKKVDLDRLSVRLYDFKEKMDKFTEKAKTRNAEEKAIKDEEKAKADKEKAKADEKAKPQQKALEALKRGHFDIPNKQAILETTNEDNVAWKNKVDQQKIKKIIAVATNPAGKFKGTPEEIRKKANDYLVKLQESLHSKKSLDDKHRKEVEQRKTDTLNKEVLGYKNGGEINGLKGGKLKGYGGGDRNLALLEDGEFIVRKEAVKHHGTDTLHKLNNMQVTLPKFATGGSVGGVNLPSSMSGNSGLNDTTNINFNMPNGKGFAMKSSPDVATALAQEFKRLG